MKTVGELLQSARIKHGLSVDDVSRITHIRKPYIEALENNEYNLLPSSVYARGFIKNYAENLNLSSDTLLAVFRRDFTENPQGQIIPRSMVETVSTQPWWYSRIILAAAGGFILTLFLLFVVWQYTNLIKPKLVVISPEENQVIQESTIKVNGITDPSAVVDINGQLVSVSATGEFETQIPVTGNQMSVVITATNRRRNATQIKRQIIARPRIVPAVSPIVPS